MLQDVEARLSAVLVAEYTPQHSGDIKINKCLSVRSKYHTGERWQDFHRLF